MIQAKIVSNGKATRFIRVALVCLQMRDSFKLSYRNLFAAILYSSLSSRKPITITSL